MIASACPLLQRRFGAFEVGNVAATLPAGGLSTVVAELAYACGRASSKRAPPLLGWYWISPP